MPSAVSAAPAAEPTASGRGGTRPMILRLPANLFLTIARDPLRGGSAYQAGEAYNAVACANVFDNYEGNPDDEVDAALESHGRSMAEKTNRAGSMVTRSTRFVMRTGRPCPRRTGTSRWWSYAAQTAAGFISGSPYVGPLIGEAINAVIDGFRSDSAGYLGAMPGERGAA